ncbi:MAG: hypothetical protein HY594_02125 [Candidatus Omnitrophica bacterium]|nr:hypothetical protein [Candidatus Omnitrophota bacterium]
MTFQIRRTAFLALLSHAGTGLVPVPAAFAMRNAQLQTGVQRAGLESSLKRPAQTPEKSGLEETALREAAEILRGWADKFDSVDRFDNADRFDDFDPDDPRAMPPQVLLAPSLVGEFAQEIAVLNRVLPQIPTRAFARVYAVDPSGPIPFLGNERTFSTAQKVTIPIVEAQLYCLTADDEESLLEDARLPGAELVLTKNGLDPVQGMAILLKHLYASLLDRPVDGLRTEEVPEITRLAGLLLAAAGPDASSAVAGDAASVEENGSAAVEKTLGIIFSQGRREIPIQVTEGPGEIKMYQLTDGEIEGTAEDYSYSVRIEEVPEEDGTGLLDGLLGRSFAGASLVFRLHGEDESEPLPEEERNEFSRYQIYLVDPQHPGSKESKPMVDRSGFVRAAFPLDVFGLPSGHDGALRFEIRRDDTDLSETDFGPLDHPWQSILDLPPPPVPASAGMEESAAKQALDVLSLWAKNVGVHALEKSKRVVIAAALIDKYPGEFAALARLMSPENTDGAGGIYERLFRWRVYVGPQPKTKLSFLNYQTFENGAQARVRLREDAEKIVYLTAEENDIFGRALQYPHRPAVNQWIFTETAELSDVLACLYETLAPVLARGDSSPRRAVRGEAGQLAAALQKLAGMDSAGMEEDPRAIAGRMMADNRLTQLESGQVIVQATGSGIDILARADAGAALPARLYAHYAVMPKDIKYLFLPENRGAVLTVLMNDSQYANDPTQCGIVLNNSAAGNVLDWLPVAWRTDSGSKVPILRVADPISSQNHLYMLLAAAAGRKDKILDVSHLEAAAVRLGDVEYTLLRAA